MTDTSFGIQLAPTFTSSVKTWAGAAVPLSLAGAFTLGVYGLFRWPAQQLLEDDRVYSSVAVDLVGLIVAGTLAVPWYFYALAAVDGREINLIEPFVDKRAFAHQAVASFWFWAAVLLGLRYLFGIPSLFVVLLYAFHGFVIADGTKGGMMALGQSVRLTEGKRVGLFAIAGLLMIFNLFGAIAAGFDGLPTTARILGAGLGLVVTTSITLVIGATIYREFAGE